MTLLCGISIVMQSSGVRPRGKSYCTVPFGVWCMVYGDNLRMARVNVLVTPKRMLQLSKLSARQIVVTRLQQPRSRVLRRPREPLASLETCDVRPGGGSVVDR